MALKKFFALLCAALLCMALPVAALEASDIESALEACRNAQGLLPDTPKGDSFSSAVMVQEMKLRLLQGDEERFKTLYGALKRHFRSPLTLLYSRLDGSLRPVAWENSTAVDLQLCRVLLDASLLWHDQDYRAEALKIARWIRRHNVRHDVLIDGAVWKERPSRIFSICEPRKSLNLSIIDVPLLQQLQQLDPAWEPVAQRSLGILLAGGGREPRKYYDVEKRRYSDEGAAPVERMAIMAHLIDGGLAPLHAMETFLEDLSHAPQAYLKKNDTTVVSAVLGAYVLKKTGHGALSDLIMETLEGDYLSHGLLGDHGQEPSVWANLLYLSIKELLKKDS